MKDMKAILSALPSALQRSLYRAFCAGKELTRHNTLCRCWGMAMQIPQLPGQRGKRSLSWSAHPKQTFPKKQTETNNAAQGRTLIEAELHNKIRPTMTSMSSNWKWPENVLMATVCKACRPGRRADVGRWAFRRVSIVSCRSFCLSPLCALQRHFGIGVDPWQCCGLRAPSDPDANLRIQRYTGFLRRGPGSSLRKLTGSINSNFHTQ